MTRRLLLVAAVAALSFIPATAWDNIGGCAGVLSSPADASAVLVVNRWVPDVPFVALTGGLGAGWLKQEPTTATIIGHKEIQPVYFSSAAMAVACLTAERIEEADVIALFEVKLVKLARKAAIMRRVDVREEEDPASIRWEVKK